MRAVLRKLMDRAVDHVAIRTGWARRYFEAQRGRICVLTYHGLIPNELADRPWVPSHFVTVRQFERQMAMLADLGRATVQPLGRVMTRMRAGTPPREPVVCLTFDDGTADNVTLALPILEQYGLRATFFLATGHVDRHELLANDVSRLLCCAHAQGRLNGHVGTSCQKLLTEPGFNKRQSLFAYRAQLNELWAASQDAIDPAAAGSLRMMTWDDARVLRDAGMEIGAHTINHVILTLEDRATRCREITDSITAVRERLGCRNVPFAYPNGLAGDYDVGDVELLESLGDVPYAVTAVPGWNDSSTPRMELRRRCVGLHGSDQAFLAQVFGLHDAERHTPLRRSA